MIWLIRPDANERDASALAKYGIDSLICPLLEIAPVADASPAILLADRLAKGQAWLIITSARTWSNWQKLVPGLQTKLVDGLACGLRIAAVGKRSAASLPEQVQNEILVSSGIDAADLARRLSMEPASTALIPGSSRSRPLLAEKLASFGWRSWQVAVYHTRQIAKVPAPPGNVDAVLVRSASAADALASSLKTQTLTAEATNRVAPRLTVFAPGPVSAARAREYGWHVVELGKTSPLEVAKQIAAYFADEKQLKMLR